MQKKQEPELDEDQMLQQAMELAAKEKQEAGPEQPADPAKASKQNKSKGRLAEQVRLNREREEDERLSVKQERLMQNARTGPEFVDMNALRPFWQEQKARDAGQASLARHFAENPASAAKHAAGFPDAVTSDPRMRGLERMRQHIQRRERRDRFAQCMIVLDRLIEEVSKCKLQTDPGSHTRLNFLLGPADLLGLLNELPNRKKLHRLVANLAPSRQGSADVRDGWLSETERELLRVMPTPDLMDDNDLPSLPTSCPPPRPSRDSMPSVHKDPWASTSVANDCEASSGNSSSVLGVRRPMHDDPSEARAAAASEADPAAAVIWRQLQPATGTSQGKSPTASATGHQPASVNAQPSERLSALRRPLTKNELIKLLEDIQSLRDRLSVAEAQQALQDAEEDKHQHVIDIFDSIAQHEARQEETKSALKPSMLQRKQQRMQKQQEQAEPEKPKLIIFHNGKEESSTSGNVGKKASKKNPGLAEKSSAKSKASASDNTGSKDSQTEAGTLKSKRRGRKEVPGDASDAAGRAAPRAGSQNHDAAAIAASRAGSQDHDLGRGPDEPMSLESLRAIVDETRAEADAHRMAKQTLDKFGANPYLRTRDARGSIKDQRAANYISSALRESTRQRSSSPGLDSNWTADASTPFELGSHPELNPQQFSPGSPSFQPTFSELKQARADVSRNIMDAPDDFKDDPFADLNDYDLEGWEDRSFERKPRRAIPKSSEASHQHSPQHHSDGLKSDGQPLHGGPEHVAASLQQDDQHFSGSQEPDQQPSKTTQAAVTPLEQNDLQDRFCAHQLSAGSHQNAVCLHEAQHDEEDRAFLDLEKWQGPCFDQQSLEDAHRSGTFGDKQHANGTQQGVPHHAFLQDDSLNGRSGIEQCQQDEEPADPRLRITPLPTKKPDGGWQEWNPYLPAETNVSKPDSSPEVPAKGMSLRTAPTRRAVPSHSIELDSASDTDSPRVPSFGIPFRPASRAVRSNSQQGQSGGVSGAADATQKRSKTPPGSKRDHAERKVREPQATHEMMQRLMQHLTRAELA